jgi:enoyl-CoA hydratase/carnithine racemase
MRSSTAPETLLTSIDEGVLTLVLNRPEQRNAIDPALRQALLDALETAALDGLVRGVVIAGAGGTFCAGAALGHFDPAEDPRAQRHAAHALTELGERIERLEKPVVAAIDGVVTGAGLALALACDWRVGAPAARILFREGRLGLVPTHGGLTRLVKLVGLGRAREALLGGEDLDALRALELGLLSELAGPGEDVADRARARVQKMLDRAPLSFGAAKRLLLLAADVDSRSAIVAESLAQASLLQSEDHREGLAARHERREPEFRGR